jgi:hypothetical protein
VLVGIAMFTVVVATLSVNIAANVVSPANDFANLAPKHITFKMGGIATGVIGVLMFPWKLMADPRGYIFAWLIGYSGGLGSIAGVLVCDYWLVRHKRLVLADLYRPDGTYPRVSWAGVVATLVGCFLAWIGLVVRHSGHVRCVVRQRARLGPRTGSGSTLEVIVPTARSASRSSAPRHRSRGPCGPTPEMFADQKRWQATRNRGLQVGTCAPTKARPSSARPARS